MLLFQIPRIRVIPWHYNTQNLTRVITAETDEKGFALINGESGTRFFKTNH